MSLALKLYPQQDLNQKSLPTELQNVCSNYLRDTGMLAYYLWILGYAWIFWRIYILKKV